MSAILRCEVGFDSSLRAEALRMSYEKKPGLQHVLVFSTVRIQGRDCELEPSVQTNVRCPRLGSSSCAHGIVRSWHHGLVISWLRERSILAHTFNAHAYTLGHFVAQVTSLVQRHLL